jgi:hypothetical protein
VTLTALKWSGAAVRFGSLVAATTVRVIADWAGVVCARQGAGSTIAPSNIIPIVLNCMLASQFKGSPNYHTLSERLLEWPAALAAIGWLPEDVEIKDQDRAMPPVSSPLHRVSHC